MVVGPGAFVVIKEEEFDFSGASLYIHSQDRDIVLAKQIKDSQMENFEDRFGKLRLSTSKKPTHRVSVMQGDYVVLRNGRLGLCYKDNFRKMYKKI